MLLIGSILSILAGLILGSFMMVLIPRLYKEESGILFGRSHCASCKHALSTLDLIPLFSFIFQRGKCRYCEKKISRLYPIVESVMAISLFALFMNHANTLLGSSNPFYPLVFSLLALHIFILIFTFFYDLLYFEISDIILVPAIVIALLQTLIPNNLVLPTISDAIIGAAIPLSIFTLQIVISKGKWLGLGDLRIGAYMGLLLGAEKTIVALIITYTLGALVASILLITKQATRKTAIPFGPFLVSGTLIALFLGNIILDWYFNKLLLLL